jgi:hypothetical protein
MSKRKTYSTTAHLIITIDDTAVSRASENTGTKWHGQRELLHSINQVFSNSTVATHERYSVKFCGDFGHFELHPSGIWQTTHPDLG